MWKYVHTYMCAITLDTALWFASFHYKIVLQQYSHTYSGMYVYVFSTSLHVINFLPSFRFSERNYGMKL